MAVVVDVSKRQRDVLARIACAQHEQSRRARRAAVLLALGIGVPVRRVALETGLSSNTVLDLFAAGRVEALGGSRLVEAANPRLVMTW